MLKPRANRPRRKYLYSLRYRLGEYSLRAWVAIFPHLSKRLLMAATDAAASLTFLLLRSHRRRMEETLFSVIGKEIPGEEQRRTILRRAWRNFARGAYEAGSTIHASKDEIRALVAVEGEDHLRQALAKGKGVVALSAHLGNFTLIGSRLAAAGYPFSVLVKQPKDTRFARLIDHYRAVVGIRTISAKPRRKSVREILRALRSNGIVLLIADEFKSGGVEVEFLGRRAPAPRGPITLAMRTGAAVVPMFVTRDQVDRLTLRISPEIHQIKTGNRNEEVAVNTALFSKQLEEMVRRYPDQWTWLGFRENGKRASRKGRARKRRLKEPRARPLL